MVLNSEEGKPDPLTLEGVLVIICGYFRVLFGGPMPLRAREGIFQARVMSSYEKLLM